MIRTKKNNKVVRKTAGRKGVYQSSFLIRVYHLCLLGASDTQIARAFDVNPTTIDYWKKHKPDFLQQMNKGKMEADAKVAYSFYKRATGYSYQTEQIVPNRVKEYDENGNIIKEHTEIIRVPITKHVIPDTSAASKWLANRQRANWSDVQRHEITGENGGAIMIQGKEIDFTDIKDSDLQGMVALIMNKTKDDSSIEDVLAIEE